MASFAAWQGEDGRPYAALVMDCNRGGSGWPPWVVFYTAGPKVPGQIDVSNIVGHGRQSVAELLSIPDGVRLSLGNSPQDDEAECCGTVDNVTDFTWDGSQVRGEVVKRITESGTARKAFLAVLEKDRTTVRQLFTSQGRKEAAAPTSDLGAYNPAIWSKVTECSSLTGRLNQFVRDDDRADDRICIFTSQKANLVATLQLQHTGFGSWWVAHFTVQDVE